MDQEFIGGRSNIPLNVKRELETISESLMRLELIDRTFVGQIVLHITSGTIADLDRFEKSIRKRLNGF